MDTTDFEKDGIPPETEAERQSRFVWEAERLAEAYADVAAGRVIDWVDVKQWLQSLGTDHELPVPTSGR